MLQETKKKSLQNIHLVLADAAHLPFLDHSFRVIYCFTVVDRYLMPQVLLQIAKKMKNGGLLVISILKKAITKEEMIRVVKYSGFEIIKISEDLEIKDHIALCKK